MIVDCQLVTDARPISGGGRPRTDAPEKPTETVLLIRLGDRHYGLPIGAVERVLPMAHVSRLPDAGAAFLGMLNLRGQVLPVLDPRPLLGLPDVAPAAEHRLVLLTSTTRFLIWVDTVEEVVAYTSDDLSDVPAQQAHSLVRAVLRLGEAIVPVLSPAALEPRVAAS
ncbi:MAG TPA: chemotaxis protein CheW [Chloroflexota bacterium]|nr:chemotaxis protein CheW [Chloroflexota bacterium]